MMRICLMKVDFPDSPVPVWDRREANSLATAQSVKLHNNLILFTLQLEVNKWLIRARQLCKEMIAQRIAGENYRVRRLAVTVDVCQTVMQWELWLKTLVNCATHVISFMIKNDPKFSVHGHSSDLTETFKQKTVDTSQAAHFRTIWTSTWQSTVAKRLKVIVACTFLDESVKTISNEIELKFSGYLFLKHWSMSKWRLNFIE